MDVIQREDLVITNSSYVRVHKPLFEFTQTVGMGRGKDGGHIGAGEIGTAIKLEGKRIDQSGIKGHVNDILISEGRGSDIEIKKLTGEINVVKVSRTRNSAGSTKDTDVGGNLMVGNAGKEFIKGNMLRSVDRGGGKIKVENILHGLGVTEKDTSASIRDRTIRTANTRREGNDAATKGTEEAKMSFPASAELKRGDSTFTMNSDIVKTKVVMKGIGPELSIKSSAAKETANGITNVTVTAFNRTILMGGGRSSRFNIVSSLGKQRVHLGRATDFTTQIHAHVLVGGVTRTAMSGEPTIDEFERWVFAREGSTVEITTEVVSDENVACFTMESVRR
jgi:hypothetical protein